MTKWSLTIILEEMHKDIQHHLRRARQCLGHPGAKGDVSEKVWLELFQNYLPARYQTAKAYVVDSKNKFSQQIDVVIFDRQYSPFICNFGGEKIIPAESVYAVFEVKQSINTKHIEYAQKKVESVRCLHRTALPIPHAGGTYSPRSLIPILGGILSLDSGWSPALGSSLLTVLRDGTDDQRLNFGCVAEHGYFEIDKELKDYKVNLGEKSATAFLLKLISCLQDRGTVPMIDVEAYAKWLED